VSRAHARELLENAADAPVVHGRGRAGKKL
jgi:hypothetical protein